MNTSHSLLISDYRYLLGLIPTVKVSHCFQEANQYANKLVKKGATQQEDFIAFDCLSSNILMLLFFDVSDMYSLSKLSFFNLINL